MQEAVVGVTHIDDVAQLFVRCCWPAAFHIPVSLCWRNDREALRAVLVAQLPDGGALGLALRAPVCPEKEEDDSSLQLIDARHTRADAQASLQARREASFETDTI